MGMLSGLAKAGMARKVMNEARKPKNQQKIKGMISSFTNKGSGKSTTRKRGRA